MVFFVLSGFLVGGSVLRALDKGSWTWSDYLIRRLSRLYMVLLPALTVGALLDIIAAHTAGYQLAVNRMALPIYPVDIRAFLGNLFFLQKIFVDPLGSNGPLWSLSYEFWYYLAFPLLAIALWPGRSILRRAVNLVGCACICILVGKTISLYGLIWLMGAAVSLLPPIHLVGHIRGKALALVLVASVLGYTAIEKRLPWELADFGCAILVAALVYVLVLPTSDKLPVLFKRIAHRLSESSYTLYLVHLPFMAFFFLVFGLGRWTPNVRTVMYSIPIIIVVFVYAQVMYVCFEKRTPALRQFLLRRLGSRRGQQTAHASRSHS